MASGRSPALGSAVTLPCWRHLPERFGLVLPVRDSPLHGRRWHTWLQPVSSPLAPASRQAHSLCALLLCETVTTSSSCCCVATQLPSLSKLHACCLVPLTHSQRQLLAAVRLIWLCPGCCTGQLLAALAAGEDHMDHHLRHESPTTIKQRQSARRRSPGRSAAGAPQPSLRPGMVGTACCCIMQPLGVLHA